MDINKESIEQMIAQILAEKLGQMGQLSGDNKKQTAGNIIKVKVPDIKTESSDRLDTGKAADQVYTHDLFTLSESPRLGCGIMEMENHF